MHSEEIRESLRKKARILQVPNRGKYQDYGSIGPIVKTPILPGITYETWPLNEHHFKPFYHKRYILPTIFKLFESSYRPFEFREVAQTYKGYDISYLVPKRNYRFEVYGYSVGEHYQDVGFDFLRSGTSGTEYHKLYRYYHSCSRVINLTRRFGKILFISGDSTLIPDIPVLACLYREVWYFDNRDGRSYIENFNNRNVGKVDVLFQIGFGGKEVYWNHNLR